MPGLQTASAIGCLMIILFSCNNRKTSSPAAITLPVSNEKTDSAATATAVEIDGFHDGYIEQSAQQYHVARNKITQVGARGKLQVKVDPSVLETEDGMPVDGDIDVRIVELLNSDDLFKANAATCSNGRLLMSGGSYYIGMTSGGKKLRIRRGNTLEVHFPVIKENEMELFYGQRDSAGSMNWEPARVPFNRGEESTDNFNLSERPAYPEFKVKQTLFNSGKSPVYINDRYTTLEQLVKECARNGSDKILDTVYFYYPTRTTDMINITHKARLSELWGIGSGFYVSNVKDMSWRGHFSYSLRLISAKEREKEKDSLLHAKLIYDSLVKKWESERVTVKLSNYYDPLRITQLGWINCDRFYNRDQRGELELELPITKESTRLKYYVIFRAFNGVINGDLEISPGKTNRIVHLPIGEPATLIAFSDKNGVISQFRKNVVIDRIGKIQLDMQPVSKEEMTKYFSKGARG